ncbi:MAG TPA: diphthamide synthesis protein [Candidatus Nanoarchaeia archaeon]|nr:diphthamide synthesis protein [Candidatus Nanoarchaeia archaeon]
MKKIFIPVTDEFKLPSVTELIKDYKKILITSTIQFSAMIDKLKDLLKNHDITIIPPVLGCSKINTTADAIIIITTGEFHAINIALRTGKPVFVIGPNGVKRISDKDIKDLQKKKAMMISKVLDAKIIGVLLSTKPGQEHEEIANELISKLKSKGKEAYLFVANELSPSQLNDFPVDAWINTACPRISEDEFDKPIVNHEDIKEHL